MRKAFEMYKEKGYRCYEILISKYWHKYTMKEIAEEFGLATESSARTIKKRCVKKLKKIYFELLRF